MKSQQKLESIDVISSMVDCCKLIFEILAGNDKMIEVIV